MTNAYITKREAPSGYVAVTRRLAQALYDRNHQIVLCSAEVGTYNVLEGECRGYPVLKATSTRPFPLLVYDYLHALPKSLGQVCVFYARQDEANSVLEEISKKKVIPKVRRPSHSGRH